MDVLPGRRPLLPGAARADLKHPPGATRRVQTGAVTPEIDERLLAHLAVELRDPGRRAVEYLRTAGALLAGDLHASPRLPETVAYCLREAMVALLDAAPALPSPGRWRDRSRDGRADRSYRCTNLAIRPVARSTEPAER